jgi:hypothetical protein
MGVFYSPARESSRWVSETRTCPGRGPDKSDNHLWNPAKKLDKTGVTQDKADRLNMFRLALWNPDKELGKVERPNMSGLGLWNLDKEPDKAERPEMSELGVRHVWP